MTKKSNVNITNYKQKQKEEKPETVDDIEDALDEEMDSRIDGEGSDEYEKKACEFLNESECEEELDSEGLNLKDVERKHFGEDKQ